MESDLYPGVEKRHHPKSRIGIAVAGLADRSRVEQIPLAAMEIEGESLAGQGVEITDRSRIGIELEQTRDMGVSEKTKPDRGFSQGEKCRATAFRGQEIFVGIERTSVIQADFGPRRTLLWQGGKPGNVVGKQALDVLVGRGDGMGIEIDRGSDAGNDLVVISHDGARGGKPLQASDAGTGVRAVAGDVAQDPGFLKNRKIETAKNRLEGFEV